MSRKRQRIEMESGTYFRGDGSRSLDRYLTDISQRISPLIDTRSIDGFGVKIYETVMGLDNYAFQTNRVTNEEQKKHMQKVLKELICKLGARVYNEIATEPLPIAFRRVIPRGRRSGGKRKRKTRRRMRGKRKGKTRRKTRR